MHACLHNGDMFQHGRGLLTQDAAHHEQHADGTAGTSAGPGDPLCAGPAQRVARHPETQQNTHAASAEWLHHHRTRLPQSCWPSKPPNNANNNHSGTQTGQSNAHSQRKSSSAFIVRHNRHDSVVSRVHPTAYSMEQHSTVLFSSAYWTGMVLLPQDNPTVQALEQHVCPTLHCRAAKCKLAAVTDQCGSRAPGQCHQQQVRYMAKQLQQRCSKQALQQMPSVAMCIA